MAQEIQDLKVLAKLRAQQWLDAGLDGETDAAVRKMIVEEGEELVEAFYTDLEFGTGGLRGLMGAGTNRMNRYSVAQATQGLAQYILGSGHIAPAVAIAHDSRNGSPEFARIAAEVLAGNGIDVHLYSALRPTPQLSFTVRHLGCIAGIVVTASHNPKEYNGYKVYWNDGGQIVPPHDKGIIDEVRKVERLDAVRWATDEEATNRIHMLGSDADEPYLDAVMALRMDEGLMAGGSDLSIVYTPLHGTGSVSVIPALKKAGFRNVHVVESQREPNGNFPTVHSPNPEEGAALASAIELAGQVDAKLVIGTDPDADRVGIAVPDSKASGGFRLLNGNETGALLVAYVLESRNAAGCLHPETDFVAKTIVTSELIADLGRAYGLKVHETLTGFKWIADVIRREEGKSTFVVGGEESYGYMIGDAVRDKDAVAAAVVLAELAHAANETGMDFLGKLEAIHRQFGAYREALISQTKQGRSGKEIIAQQMELFRSNPPQQLGGQPVLEMRDYRSGSRKNLRTGQASSMELPMSNVIQFLTADRSLVTARPSGTEPKIKFYFSVMMPPEEVAAFADYESAISVLDQRIKALQSDLGTL